MADGHRTLRKRGAQRVTPREGPSPEPGGSALDLLRAGANWLVHPTGHRNARSRAFAAGLTAEPETDIVVVDLPRDVGPSDLEALAQALPATAARLRLVFGLPFSVRGVEEPGRWLADRLQRTVTLAAGDPEPAAAGRLFIPVGSGSGWLSFSPAGPASNMSRRFPRTVWESPILTDQEWSVSPATIVEPTATGVWVRPLLEQRLLETHRASIARTVDVPHEVLAVVLGAPGHDVGHADVVAFWRVQSQRTRASIRFFAADLTEIPVADVLARADETIGATDGRHGPPGTTAAEYPQSATAGFATTNESVIPAKSRTSSGAAFLLERGLLVEPLDLYGEDVRFVERLVMERPEIERRQASESFTELVLLRIFLTHPHRIRRPDEADAAAILDDSLRAALGRLPTYRGEANVQVALQEETVTDRYGTGRIIAEADPFSAYLNGQVSPPELTSFSIWSESARRTALVQPEVPDRLVFAPGSRFKVLGHLEGRRVVLLRQLTLDDRAERTAAADRQALEALIRAHRERLRDGSVGAMRPGRTHPAHRAPGLGQPR
ncbi:hypothetical protein ABT088_50515 [Streptomyces mirabilis]|uniref:hypothetical protein n=1 Tax=Streptomyces mirabilis TaxID=68239 RepID=UPI003331CAA2